MAPHGHGCGGGENHESSEHGHDDSPELGVQYSLYKKIDITNVQCLNEAVEGSGKLVFKPWEERLNRENFVESDVDEELLFNIPFTGSVKLKGIIIIGGEDDMHPRTLKIYKNRPQMSFEEAGAPCDQEFELQRDVDGILEYPTKPVKFADCTHLSLYFKTNFGADTSKVFYIGLKGEFTEVRRQEITLCNYELAPNPADHKIDSLNPVSHTIQ